MKVRRIAAGLLLAASALVTGLMAAPAASAAPGAARARPAGGHGLIVSDRPGPDRGHLRRGHRPVPRHPVRGAAGRRAALGGAPAGAALAGRPPGHVLRRPVRAAGQRQRPPGRQRGLPVPQRVHAAGPRLRTRSRRAPRARHDPRRRAHHRRRRPARRVPDRDDRPHHRRVDQLPARPVRLPRRARARLGRGRRERQLRPARPGGRAALGAAQHRRLRRRPGQGHDRRRVGGRLVGLRAADLAAGPRAVPRRDHAKRQLRLAEPGHRAGRRASRSPSRPAAPTRRPRRRACAPCRKQTLLDASTSYQPEFTYGGPELPAADASAVAAGNYDRVPVLIGTNHDEGRTFAQGFTGLTEAQADALITTRIRRRGRRPSSPATRGAPTRARTRPPT